MTDKKKGAAKKSSTPKKTASPKKRKSKKKEVAGAEASAPEKPKAPVSRGIVLLAFGKRGYHFAAYNLALSIKRFNPNLKIALLWHGEGFHQIHDKSVFDVITQLPASIVYEKGKLDPAKVKTHIYDVLPFDENLYLDVDACALKDIAPLLNQLCDMPGFYLTDVTGVGGKGDNISYAIWANHADIWDFFELPPSAQYPAIQSSFAFIRKQKAAEAFFDKLKGFYAKGFPLDKLSMRWGGTVPDELLFSGTCAKMKVSPQSGIRPIFFGWQFTPLSFSQLTAQYYLTSIYGNGQGNTLTKLRYLEWYSRLMANYARKMGRTAFKHHYIMQDKHANF